MGTSTSHAGAAEVPMTPFGVVGLSAAQVEAAFPGYASAWFVRFSGESGVRSEP